MTDTIPDFDGAVETFQRILHDQHVRGDMVWVRSSDLVVWRSRLYVLGLVSGENDARADYARGRAGGIGVCLQVVCRCGPRLCCCVWFPKDRLDAEYRMSSRLKLTCPTRIREARLVKNRLIWGLLKRLGRNVDV